jgi:hypothetical protein
MCGEAPKEKAPKKVKEPKVIEEPVQSTNEDGEAIFDENGDPVFEDAPEKKTRATATKLSGPYHFLKGLPNTSEDHPKYVIWQAIASNDTVEAAIASCPTDLPARKTSGSYSFASEFRYFLKKGFVVMGTAPEVSEDTSEDPTEAA